MEGIKSVLQTFAELNELLGPFEKPDDTAEAGVAAALNIAGMNLDPETCLLLEHTAVPKGDTFADGVKSVAYSLMLIAVNAGYKFGGHAQNSNIQTRDLSSRDIEEFHEKTRVLLNTDNLHSGTADDGIRDVKDMVWGALDDFEKALYNDILDFYRPALEGTDYWAGYMFARSMLVKLGTYKFLIGC